MQQAFDAMNFDDDDVVRSNPNPNPNPNPTVDDDERVFVKPMTKSMLLKLRSTSLKLENNPIPFMKRMEKRCQDYRESVRLKKPIPQDTPRYTQT
ncbi:hypothetical protein FCV25MIE_23086 [Fagus crenata]